MGDEKDHGEGHSEFFSVGEYANGVSGIWSYIS